MSGAGMVLRITGASGAGKTTLIERLVRALTEAGYRVATVKSARHHTAPPDRPGSDTRRLLRVGSVASAGLFEDGAVVRLPHEVDAVQVITWLSLIADIVLVEGGQGLDLPALWIASGDAREPPAGNVIATVSAASRPGMIHRDDIEAIAALVSRLALRA